MNHESETAAAPCGEQAADNDEQSTLDSPFGCAASVLKTRKRSNRRRCGGCGASGAFARGSALAV